MMRVKKLIPLTIVIITILSLPGQVPGQACCTSGTPILGTLELPAGVAGSFQTALTYQFNTLDDVINESTPLEESLRRRFTHSLVLESNYGLSDSWAVSGLLSFIRQGRHNNTLTSGKEVLKVTGLGDAVVLVKYSPLKATLFSQRNLSVGAGPKIPLGDFRRRNKEGILLPYEMQPGTGAWDLILWSNFYQGFRPVPLSIYLTTAYRLTGRNSLGYQFGRELTLNSGMTYDSSFPVDFSLAFKYRAVAPDSRNGQAIANTGGKWLNLKPAFYMHPVEKFTLKLSGQLPLYREVNGIQLTTSYRISVTGLVNFRINSQE